MKKVLLLGLIFFSLFLLCPHAKTDSGPATLFVTANHLNGRASPSKSSMKEAYFDEGDEIEATGKWSRDHNWIEVYGGESETCWVNIQYVTEQWHRFGVTNYGTKIKIRSKPVNGTVRGYLKKNERAEVDQVVLGWGHLTKGGWIDLDYVITEDQ